MQSCVVRDDHPAIVPTTGGRRHRGAAVDRACSARSAEHRQAARRGRRGSADRAASPRGHLGAVGGVVVLSDDEQARARRSTSSWRRRSSSSGQRSIATEPMVALRRDGGSGGGAQGQLIACMSVFLSIPTGRHVSRARSARSCVVGQADARADRAAGATSAAQPATRVEEGRERARTSRTACATGGPRCDRRSDQSSDRSRSSSLTNVHGAGAGHEDHEHAEAPSVEHRRQRRDLHPRCVVHRMTEVDPRRRGRHRSSRR